MAVKLDQYWLRIDGEAVRRLRLRLNLRQSDVTARLRSINAHWGLSPSVISQIETRNKHVLNPRQATALAAVLGVSVWAILKENPAGATQLAEAKTLAGELETLVGKLADVLGVPVPEQATGDGDGSTK